MCAKDECTSVRKILVWVCSVHNLGGRQINLPATGVIEDRVHEISLVVRIIDTTNGKLSVDVINKEECEDKHLASELRPRNGTQDTFHIPSSLPNEYYILSPECQSHGGCVIVDWPTQCT